MSRVGPTRHSVCLRLDPALLANAELDIRFELESVLRANAAAVEFVETGYGFARHSDAMLLTYNTNTPDDFVALLVHTIENQVILGNILMLAAIVATAPEAQVITGHEYDNHRIVYPPEMIGNPLPD